MNKKYIGVVTVSFILTAGAVYAGFDRNPTSAVDDRRAITEASKEQTQLLKELVAETKKTNELLQKYMGMGSSGGGSEGRQKGSTPDGSRSDSGRSDNGVQGSSEGGRRERTR